MPFNPDEYLAAKSSFDPDSYLADKGGTSEKKVAPPSKLESAARGGAQGFTFGFADELAGLLGKLRGQGYTPTRDAYRVADKAAQKENPWTYGLSNVAGAAPSMLIPGIAPARGASMLANGARIVGQGALQGLGSGEGENTWDRVKDATVGAGANLAGAGLGKAVSAAIPTAARAAGFATDQAVRHLRPTAAVARAIGKDRLKEIGQEVLDSGALKFGNKAEDTLGALEGLVEARGKDVQKHVDAATKTTGVDTVLRRIQKDVIDPLKGTEANDSLVQDLLKRKDAMAKFYGEDPLTASMVENQKRAINKHINYKAGTNARNEAEMGLAKAFKDTGEELVDSPQFLADKSSYGKLADAKLMADRTASLAEGGTGLFDHIRDATAGHLAVGALLHGNPAGLAVPLVRQLTKGRVSSSLASGGDQLAKFLAAHPGLDATLSGGRKVIEKAAPVAARQNIWELMNQ